jgi:TRAP-type C4-dicarboxylate transport system permease small subunit
LARGAWSRALKLWDGLVSSLGLAGGLLIVAIAGLSSWDIVCRYVLRSPVVWAGEIGEYMLLACVFLTLALSWREDRHVRVDILYVYWSRKWRVRANLVFSFWALVFCAALTWYGYLQVRQAFLQGETSVTATAIPTYPVLAFIPIGAFLLCVQIIQSAWKLLRGEDTKETGTSQQTPGPKEGK